MVSKHVMRNAEYLKSRFLDLKFGMTLLLAKAVARSNVGAASTIVEKLMEEAKACVKECLHMRNNWN